MIPKTDSFSVVTETKDVLGKISEVSSNLYYGTIDRESQFSVVDNQLDVVGKGIIFTDELSDIEVGTKLLVDGESFYVKSRFIGKMDGQVHHLEIVYG